MQPVIHAQVCFRCIRAHVYQVRYIPTPTASLRTTLLVSRPNPSHLPTSFLYTLNIPSRLHPVSLLYPPNTHIRHTHPQTDTQTPGQLESPLLSNATATKAYPSPPTHRPQRNQVHRDRTTVSFPPSFFFFHSLRPRCNPADASREHPSCGKGAWWRRFDRLM